VPRHILSLLCLVLGVLGTADARAQASVPRPTVSGAAKPPAPARTPLRGAETTSAGALQRHLDALLRNSTTGGEWGVMVISLSRGDTLYARRPDELIQPASTMKLYTAAMAFEAYGPAHQFRTEILRDADLNADGTVEGNLYLRGAGDPSLSPRYSRWHDGLRPMEAIADLVWSAGVRRVRGDVVGDASAFDDRRVPDGWRRRYLQAGYAARVSALSVNENIALITVTPISGRASVEFSDPLFGVPINSTVTVRNGSAGAYIRVWQDTTIDAFRVQGWVGSRSQPRSYRVVVEHPERFAAASFRAALERRGIVVDGDVRAATAPRTAQRVTAWASPPLAQLVVTMNGESNNHFAELIFRNAARSGGDIGSAHGANEALRRFLTDRVGASRESVFAADGSGLSTLDRVTPRSMVQLLGYAHDASWSEVFKATLPVAGRTETLRTRMRGTAAVDVLRGKTGTTNEVSSLGGYVTTRAGELLAFAFIYNGPELWRAREAIDAMSVTLASFWR
jgi:serine-type D-Ala-D-Ala carboxypeptidase/endopeptidase (penicillin-binding protein 4)